MSSTVGDIAPSLWFFGGEKTQHDFQSLSDRIREDGTKVELLENAELNEKYLPAGLDLQERVRVLSFPVILLQKHGVVPVIWLSECEEELVSELTGRLEKSLFFTTEANEGDNDELIRLDPGEETSFAEEIMQIAGERGLFEEQISEDRSDEEVTDRLKNLGYI